MTHFTFISIILGVFVGYFFFPESLTSTIDTLMSYSLHILLFGVGIDLGRKNSLLKQLKNLGIKVLLVPLGVIIGTLFGSIVAGYLIKIPIHESLAIGSGFGWYSLSAIIITKSYNVEIGTLAFMTNLIRELLTIGLIPILAKKLSPISVVAPGGATTMDTTLPLIQKATDPQITVIAFVNGIVLSALVPILVSFFIQKM